MTILPRGTGIRPTSAEILFPFLGASPLLVLGEDDDPAGMGRRDGAAAPLWDPAVPARAEAATVESGHGAWGHPQAPRAVADEAGDRPAAAVVLSRAEAAGRPGHGVAADPLHGISPLDWPLAQARPDLPEPADRDWLDQTAQADAFIFLPGPPSRDPADGAGSPPMPLEAEAWFDLLVLPFAPDPGIDFGPDVVIISDHGPLAADHVLL